MLSIICIFETFTPIEYMCTHMIFDFENFRILECTYAGPIVVLEICMLFFTDIMISFDIIVTKLKQKLEEKKTKYVFF